MTSLQRKNNQKSHRLLSCLEVPPLKVLLFCAMLLCPQVAVADEASGHFDPVGHVALALVIILLVAKLGGDLAVRLGQPAVLGELIGGIMVGALPLVGFSSLEWLKSDSDIDMLAKIGDLSCSSRSASSPQSGRC